MVVVGPVLQSIPTPPASAAEERSEEEHLVILEAGAAAERELSEGSTHFAPALAMEIAPIKKWLEIEFGASRFRTSGATVWDVDLPVVSLVRR